jgi:hypothetical protein
MALDTGLSTHFSAEELAVFSAFKVFEAESYKNMQRAGLGVFDEHFKVLMQEFGKGKQKLFDVDEVVGVTAQGTQVFAKQVMGRDFRIMRDALHKHAQDKTSGTKWLGSFEGGLAAVFQAFADGGTEMCKQLRQLLVLYRLIPVATALVERGFFAASSHEGPPHQLHEGGQH